MSADSRPPPSQFGSDLRASSCGKGSCIARALIGRAQTLDRRSVGVADDVHVADQPRCHRPIGPAVRREMGMWGGWEGERKLTFVEVFARRERNLPHLCKCCEASNRLADKVSGPAKCFAPVARSFGHARVDLRLWASLLFLDDR